MVTASVRLEAPSLPHSEATWNLAVFSLIPSRRAMPLLGRPWATRFSTCSSRGVSGSDCDRRRRQRRYRAERGDGERQIEQDQPRFGGAHGEVELFGVRVARQARPAAQAGASQDQRQRGVVGEDDRRAREIGVALRAERVQRRGARRIEHPHGGIVRVILGQHRVAVAGEHIAETEAHARQRSVDRDAGQCETSPFRERVVGRLRKEL